MSICKYCNKEFVNGQQLGAHITNIHNAENRNSSISKSLTLKRIVITKQCKKCGNNFNIERSVAKNGIQNISKKERQYCNRSCANYRNHSEETKLKISKSNSGENGSNWRGGISQGKGNCVTCNIPLNRGNTTGHCKEHFYYIESYRKNISNANKGKTGGIRNGGGIGKSGWYRGYWCDSSWELAFVIYNLENNIEFKRNRKGFKYIYEGNEYRYYPDFIIDNEYYEIKGYIDKKNEAKISQFQDKLHILKKEEMKLYLDYTINKYGKDFIEKYGEVAHLVEHRTCTATVARSIRVFSTRG